MTALILGGLVAVAAVVIVSLPFLMRSDEPELLDTTEDTRGRLELLEARDRALAALKELEFDHTTGKVDDVDYRRLVGPLRRAAADALQKLDGRTSKTPPAQAPEEQAPEKLRVPEKETARRDD